MPDAETLAGAMIGPSGNLRAPVLRVGKVLVVGYEAGLYEKLLTNS